MTSKPPAASDDNNILKLSLGYPQSTSQDDVSTEKLLANLTTHATDLAKFEWERQQSAHAGHQFSTSSLESLGVAKSLKIRTQADSTPSDESGDQNKVANISSSKRNFKTPPQDGGE